MPNVRCVLSNEFYSKFHTRFRIYKNFENRLRSDKFIENLKVGTFFDTVYIYTFILIRSQHQKNI